jgi:hypothetical protein
LDAGYSAGLAGPSDPSQCREDNFMPDRDDSDRANGKETADSVATYIASMSDELAKLARRNGLDTLSYILEMARLEADQIAKD